MFKFLRRFFSGKSMADKLREEVAYHEAGHVIIGMLNGHHIGSISVDPKVPAKSFTEKNYGNDECAVKGLMSGNIALLKTLPLTQVKEGASRYGIGLSAGYAAEHYKRVGQFPNSPFRSPQDLAMLNKAAQSLIAFSVVPSQYQAHCEAEVLTLLRSPGVWQCIKLFAEAIIAKPDGCLSRVETAKLIQAAGLVMQSAK